MRATRVSIFALSLLGAVAGARAEIRYDLTPIVDAKRMQVEITVPVTGKDTVLQIPRWEPGWYFLRDYGRNVRDVVAKDEAGNVTQIVPVDDSTWRISGVSAGKVNVTYTVPVEDAGGTWSVTGPSTYMYVVGRKTEACKVTLHLPDGWKSAVGLPGEGPTFDAPDYDVLADNPLSLGQFHEIRYMVGGKPHVVVVGGPARDAIDRTKLADWCQKISEAETEFMGGPPYAKYVWHFRVGPGTNWGGGLEHLSSTVISLGQNLGSGSVSVLAHEFFHLWNVKRIRSKPLGPFDYTKLPRTGALWWLEGVTDYYAWSLLRRWNLHDDPTFYTGLLGEVRSQRRNRARLEVSPYESSDRTPDANNGRGSATGYRISYYDTGHLVGLCLDLELLYRTNGKVSLDDVVRGLFSKTKNGQPGFEEGEIRRQLVAVGGREMGDYYDLVVMTPGELPLEAALSHVGVELTSATAPSNSLGIEAREVSGRLLVANVFDPKSEIRVGDELLMGVEELTRAAQGTPGEVREITIRRAGKEMTLKQAIMSPRGTDWTLQPSATATADQVRLRQLWLSKRK